jgi:hypothetical protein
VVLGVCAVATDVPAVGHSTTTVICWYSDSFMEKKNMITPKALRVLLYSNTLHDTNCNTIM